VGARGGALADDDVQLVVLERGVELFFEDGLQAVDLVEEEDLALAQVGEDGSEVSLDLQGGAGGLLVADFELVGDDGGEGGFAQAGRAEEEDVVEGFATDLAAWRAMASCSLALVWPMNSARRVGGASARMRCRRRWSRRRRGGQLRACGRGGRVCDAAFWKFHAEAIVGRMAGLSKMGLVRGEVGKGGMELSRRRWHDEDRANRVLDREVPG